MVGKLPEKVEELLISLGIQIVLSYSEHKRFHFVIQAEDGILRF